MQTGVQFNAINLHRSYYARKRSLSLLQRFSTEKDSSPSLPDWFHANHANDFFTFGVSIWFLSTQKSLHRGDSVFPFFQERRETSPCLTENDDLQDNLLQSVTDPRRSSKTGNNCATDSSANCHLQGHFIYKRLFVPTIWQTKNVKRQKKISMRGLFSVICPISSKFITLIRHDTSFISWFWQISIFLLLSYKSATNSISLRRTVSFFCFAATLTFAIICGVNVFNHINGFFSFFILAVSTCIWLPSFFSPAAISELG